MGERTHQQVLTMRVALIGAGRLATNLAVGLQSGGHEVVQVYSRTLASAEALALRLGTMATNNLDAVVTDADAFVIAVKDAVLPEVIARVTTGKKDEAVFLHTAGSMPMAAFEGSGARHYGVLYPMQTFSKERIVDLARVPFFIEGCDNVALRTADRLACSVSNDVRELSSADRRQLHLAAVFACNFSNHCYDLSARVLKRHGLPFSVMLPLIDETAAKVHAMSPHEAQTGPALRYDENVIQAQMRLLDGDEQAQRIYEEMSKSIHETHLHND